MLSEQTLTLLEQCAGAEDPDTYLRRLLTPPNEWKPLGPEVPSITIPIRQRGIAITVDILDAPLVSQSAWHLIKGIPYRNVPKSKGGKKESLRSLLASGRRTRCMSGQQTDCRRCNILVRENDEPITNSQATQERGTPKMPVMPEVTPDWML